MKDKLHKLLALLFCLCMYLSNSPVGWTEEVDSIISIREDTLYASNYVTQQQAVNWIQARENEAWAEDYDGVYGAQCVDLIKYYTQGLFGVNLGTGNAYAYANKELPSGWYYESSPSPGDIAVWSATESNQNGHVALVKEVESYRFWRVEVDGNTHQAGAGWTYNSSPATYIHPYFSDTPLTPVLPDGDYIIAAAADTRYYLDIEGGEYPAAGETNVSLYYTPNGMIADQDAWTVRYNGNGYYRISQYRQNVSLDVYNESTANGANVQVWYNNDSYAQQWAISGDASTGYRVMARCSGKYLEYEDSVLASGTRVQQWSYDGSAPAQVWMFIPYKPSHTVTYDANGGTGAPPPQSKTHGTNLTLSTTKPTRPKSSAGSYTVTLNANGGSVSPASLSAARTTSYTFKNWNTAANGSGTSYNAGATYSTDANVTLYAQWNSSTTTASVTLPTPTRSGYIFKGWSTSNSATSGVTGSYTPSGNVTLYALWTRNDYTVTYNANGGTGAPLSQNKIHDTALTLSSDKPKREASTGNYAVRFVIIHDDNSKVYSNAIRVPWTTSYTFKNWNTDKYGTGTTYAPGATYTANASATLYAQWNSTKTTGSVPFPDSPTRPGYVFMGWATRYGASRGNFGSYTPTRDGDVTLYATWKKMDIVLPEALNEIESEAFDGCAFSSVMLSENVTAIQSRAFADCPKLRYIYIPEATTTIAKDAFSGVSGLTIFGASGSYAEFFAQRNGYTFVAAD